MSDIQVEIYVRSSPLGEVGIHWRNISKLEQPNEEPVVLKERVIVRNDGKQVTINSLINDTKPSLILAQYKNKVLLELTGLDAAEVRSKSMGRKISEIVLWIGDVSPKVECQLRKLAACALLSFWQKESNLLTTIRDSIDFDGLNSFKVDIQQIEQLYTDADTHLDLLLSEVSSRVIDTSKSVWLTPKTIDIESQLYDLINQISQTPLPDTEQPVVVVAEFKKEGGHRRIVYRGNVWNAPETKAQKKTTEPSLKTVPPTEPSIPPQTPTSPSRLTIATLMLGLGILIVVILIAIWIIVQCKIPTPVPTSTPTPAPILKEKPFSKTTSPQSSLQPAHIPVLPDHQPLSSQSLSPNA